MKGVSHGLSSLLSPRVSKDKWNGPNGLEEKEIWVEEDQLFEVRGKSQTSLALLQMSAGVRCMFLLRPCSRASVPLPGLILNHQGSDCVCFVATGSCSGAQAGLNSGSSCLSLPGAGITAYSRIWLPVFFSPWQGVGETGSHIVQYVLGLLG